MRYKIFLVIFMIGSLAACHTSQKSNTSTNTDQMKAMLINGTWEANYVMGTPKPFAEQYALQKPTITFDTEKKTVAGNTGCNSFQGAATVVENKLSFPAEFATTRKMCPDMAGEQAFLAALKKVNSYSVTEQGKTLNLIAGDIAVMRLVRK